MSDLVRLKHCPDCNLDKSEDDFYLRSSGKRNTYCIPCHRERGYRNSGYTPKLRRSDRPQVIDGKLVCLRCGGDPQPVENYRFLRAENRRSAVCKDCVALADIRAADARHEKQLTARRAIYMNEEKLMQFFKYDHLPQQLQVVSKPFGELADKIVVLPKNSERTVALRKLLEAKDCAVRAMIFK